MIHTRSLCANNMRKQGIVFLLVSLFSCTWCTATTYGQFSPLSQQPLYGAYAHWISSIHTANFQTLAGTSLSNQNTAFTTGSGRGSAFGIAASIPFSAAFSNAAIASRVHLGLRVGYQQYDGTLQAERDTLVYYRGRPERGVVQHTIDASLASITLEPLLGVSPFGGLQFHIGGHIGIPLSTAFIHQQKFIRPAQPSTTPELVAGAEEHGDIADVPPLHIATLLGMSYAFPLDTRERLFFIPEVFVSIPISNVSRTVEWNVSTVRAGVQVLYTPSVREAYQRDTVLQRDTVERVSSHAQREKVYFADATISIQTERASNREFVLIREQYIRERPAPQLPLAPTITWSIISTHATAQEESVELQRHTAQYVVPLLPFVFFDSSSSHVPSRYNQLKPEHTEEFGVLPATDMPTVHSNILNIIGHKLRHEDKQTIVLTGCTDGIAETRAIAQQRAERIRTYLLRVWNISPERIQLQTRTIPEHPSNSATPEGAAENRRVEVSFGKGEQTLHTMVQHLHYIVPLQKVVLHCTTANAASSWQLVLTRSGRELYQRSGTGVLPDTLVWYPDSTCAQNNIAPIECSLRVRDAAHSKEEHAQTQIPVHMIEIQPVTGTEEAYPLLLFPFGETALSAQQEAELLLALSNNREKLVVIGSTDAIGDEHLNLALSVARAQAVARVLGLPATHVRGLGERGALYDNTLPEGRFYNRMVRIERAEE